MIQASLIAQLVKSPPAMQETPVSFLGREDLMEKGLATHSHIQGISYPLQYSRNISRTKKSPFLRKSISSVL